MVGVDELSVIGAMAVNKLTGDQAASREKAGLADNELFDLMGGRCQRQVLLRREVNGKVELLTCD